jgi:hypothetical protein
MNSSSNIHTRANPRKNLHLLPARRKTSAAAERRFPKMHWQWRRRGRDILALLNSRFGSALPDDDAGLDAAKLLAQHYMRLHVDAERVTRANLRIWAPWLSEKTITSILNGAKVTKAASAAKLGKEFRVTADEVAALGLQTIRALTVTREADRDRQALRRRKAGATAKRGRPPLGLSPGDKKAREKLQAAERMRKMRALRKNGHASSYIRGLKRDELIVTDPILIPHDLLDERREPKRPGACSDGMTDEMTLGGLAMARRRPTSSADLRGGQ